MLQLGDPSGTAQPWSRDTFPAGSEPGEAPHAEGWMGKGAEKKSVGQKVEKEHAASFNVVCRWMDVISSESGHAEMGGTQQDQTSHTDLPKSEYWSDTDTQL